MVKSLFFVFAVVFLLSNMILVYKVPYRISFVKCAVVCFITEICFGALIAQCCSIVNIFIDLYSVGIGYLFIGVVLFVYNLRNRKIQQLYLNRIDMYSVITICVWFGIIFLKVFTPEILLTYRNVDPANHYIWAMNVVNEGTISTMFFAELYNGLFIEILQPILTEISLYKAFILADTFANLLNVFMFYCVGSHFCKKMFSKKILPFICLGYFLGWPFYNYAIGGFVYFGWGVTLFAYIVYLIIQLKYTKDEKQSFIVWLLIIIGCYCVLVCYIYFVPIIGMIVLCELFRTIRKNGIQLDWKVKGSIAIFILCAGAIAFCVVYFGFFEGDVLYVFNALKAHGGIQNELYKDFVFLMPIVIYMFWQRFKNQELDTIYNVIGIILFWIFVTFVLCLNEFISPYYYYKSYYLLWFFAWMVCVDAIDYWYEKDIAVICSYGGVFCIVMVMTIAGVDTNASLREKSIIPNAITAQDNPSILSIYGQTELFLDKEKDYEDKKALLEICDFINKEYSQESSMIQIITTSYYIGQWFDGFGGGKGIRVENRDEYELVLEQIKNEKHKYVVIHQNSTLFRENRELLEELSIIFDNGYYGMYKVEKKQNIR